MPANAVGAEAEVAHRLEVAELDPRARERLRDDRARDVARILTRAVVIEHPRDDARHTVRVVVVHRQEVGRDLRSRVDRLRVDRRTLVQDQSAVRIEVVMVADRLPNVSVLLRCTGGVELLQLDSVIDDRLQEVQGSDGVRHDRLVGPVPRLADVCLGREVEDEWPPGGLEDAHDTIDRVAVREVSPVNGQPAAQVRDVVESAARRRPDEGVDVRLEAHQRLGQMGAHEAVGSCHEHGSAREDLADLAAEFLQACGHPSTSTVGQA